ncbi:hypothetical protein B0H10DRAFT_2231026 [Mycena sp. CBHHK59/15]|nr:hypothetical protein B0H10DRAFT_2231026 [Mycena sp. CBHHK59/15]
MRSTASEMSRINRIQPHPSLTTACRHRDAKARFKRHLPGHLSVPGTEHRSRSAALAPHVPMSSRNHLSKKSTVRYAVGGGSAVKAVIIPVNKTPAQRLAARRAYNDTVAGLSFVQRQELGALDDVDMPYTYDDSFDLGGPDNDAWEDIPQGYCTLPPGEEAALNSHAGGEALLHQMMEGVRHGRGDPRTHSFRVQKQVDAWNAQLDLLVDAFLRYKNIGCIEIEGQWPLRVVGFEESSIQLFSHPPDAQRGNETLLRHGYLGGSPERPSIAFSIRTLEIYRQIHRVCPRYTIDSLAKTLSYLHKVPRKAYLAEQLTTTYDAYLAILRRVDIRVQNALGRDKTWLSKNVCPPCFYKVKDELPLKFSFLASMDGNNSLKLVDSTFRAGHPRFDDRKSNSFRWLTPTEVDKYRDEVKTAPKVSMATTASLAAVTAALATPPITLPPPASPSTAQNQAAASSDPWDDQSADIPDGPADFPGNDNPDDDIAWLNVNELSAEDVTELERCMDTCVERWKAAGPEACKKMFALFAVAGIFLAVCRHGHVLIMCDMIRSGELMKYPLAIVAKLFELYGADIGLGSLGRKTVALRLRGIVPAFHGHAHNRGCQLGWHPTYVEGAGLEDFEECERTFCLSNNLASCTRLATPFHRQQQIDEHFHFHDMDKHAASGNFIFQNYRQAIEKMTSNKLKLRALEEQLHTTAADYQKDLKDEAHHLDSLKNEPPTSTRRDASRAAGRDFHNLDDLIINKGYMRPQIAAVRTRYRTTHTRLLLVNEEVSRFEVEHGFEERWDSASKEYQDALVMMGQRRYRRALDKLECLVVQRLLELTKLSMSGVGYKLWEKIGKALKTRADTIQRVLAEYNTAAAALNPPRDQLAWSQVVQTVTLAEFDLLRDTRNDIRRLPWTNPARREAGLLHFGIKRCEEEIRRLNIEITRTITFMIDDHIDYHRAIRANCVQQPDLANELSNRWEYNSRINEAIVERFVKASHLPGFTGSLFPGHHVGRDPMINDDHPLPPWAGTTLRLQQVVVEYEEDNDAADTARELDGVDDDMMAQLMENMELDRVEEM